MLSICLRGLAKITDEFFVGYFGKAIITRAYQTIRSRGKYGASLRKVRLDYVKKNYVCWHVFNYNCHNRKWGNINRVYYFLSYSV